ncbi:MAG: apolipoprotein N-acyltransferase [Candidatus Omnitrophota bacterium]|nr:apolipoprotein N-acyltransferase [Candidatus Omnitrophota bacterium]
MLRIFNVKKHWKKILLAALSGMLCFLAFPPFEFALLGWVCVIPLLFAIRGSGPRRAFWYAYLSGLVFFGCLLSWLVNVTVPGTIILVLILSAFYGLFGLVTGIAFKYSMDFLLLPFVWVVLEYIRSHILTGFPWGILGYSQYRNMKLIQIADFTGAYGVSFVLTVFNVALFTLLIRSKRRVPCMVIALLFMLMSTSYGMYRLNNLNSWGYSRMSVVQGNIPQQMKWDSRYAEEIIDVYSGLTRQAAKDSPDMIIWPETAYPYLVGASVDPAEEINSLAAETGIPILAGIVSSGSAGYYNSAILFTGGKKLKEVYRKIHLVPFGEYVPFGRYFDFLRGHIDKPIGDFERGDEYTLFKVKSMQFSGQKGDGSVMRRMNFYKFGVLICFEDIFPYLARTFVREGAGFLVNITNDAWFGETGAPAQHLQASVFRAVENRVPVVRAANTGISCFVDFTGEIVSILEEEGKSIFVRGYDTAAVNMCARRTYYTHYGDIFVYFCGFIIVLLVVMEAFLARRK